MTFSEVKDFLMKLGLKPRVDFHIHESIEVVELEIDSKYFCSVGKLTEDPETWEVYDNCHGIEWDEQGNALTDGEIWQFKVYKSLWRAIKEALSYKQAGKLPEVPIRKW